MVGYCFLDEFEKGLREYHIVNEGKYLYIMTLSYDDKIKLKSFLEERYEKIRSYEDKIRFLPSLDTEIKITLDKLIAERIGKILQNN